MTGVQTCALPISLTACNSSNWDHGSNSSHHNDCGIATAYRAITDGDADTAAAPRWRDVISNAEFAQDDLVPGINSSNSFRGTPMSMTCTVPTAAFPAGELNPGF